MRRSRLHSLPMCATTTTTCAPRSRSASRLDRDRRRGRHHRAGRRSSRASSWSASTRCVAPTMPTFTPATSISVDAGMFGQSIALARSARRRCSRRGTETSPRRARALSAPRGSSPALRGDRRADRAVVELVVADRGRGVAERVVRAHDVGALGEVRLERALEQIAGVDAAARRRRPPRAPRARSRRSRRAAAAARARRADRSCR